MQTALLLVVCSLWLFPIGSHASWGNLYCNGGAPGLAYPDADDGCNFAIVTRRPDCPFFDSRTCIQECNTRLNGLVVYAANGAGSCHNPAFVRPACYQGHTGFTVVDGAVYGCTHRHRYWRCSGNGDVPSTYDGSARSFDTTEVCTCDGGRLGYLGDTQQCTKTVRNDVCNGRGVDSAASSTRYLANVSPSTITCTCDAGFAGQFCEVVLQCPLVNGVLCNGHGTCPVAPNCACSTGWGGVYCCPSNTLGVCSGRGTCSSLGTCVCTAGYGGAYCCPRQPGQSKECGAHGTCQANGQCTCDSFYAGASCHINTQCPSANPGLSECSGNGACEFEADGAVLLLALHYDDDPRLAVSVNGRSFADEGQVALARDFYEHVMGMSTSAFNAMVFTTPSKALLCDNPSGSLTRLQCFAFGLQEKFAPLLSPWPFPSMSPIYAVSAWFFQQHPELSSLQPVYQSRMVADISVNGTSALAKTRRATALAALFAYRLLQNPVTGTVVYPVFPRWGCNCRQPSATAVIGVDFAPVGVACAQECPVGLGQQPCSGFFNGQFRGKCDAATSTCVCGPQFAGNACQRTLQGLCFELGSTDVAPCHGSEHGRCLDVVDRVTHLPTNLCNCTGGWTNQFCQFTRCVRLGASDAERRIACNGVGDCMAGDVCKCDVLGQLALSSSLASPPLLPVGRLCDVNGISQCGTTRSLFAGGVVWEECSGRGSCAVNSTGRPSCTVCQSGTFGDRCQFTSCSPACNAYSSCNPNTGQCGCKTMWGNPVGCVAGDRSCECTRNLCGHGEPSLDGSSCLCNRYYHKDSAGKCTILRCPLVQLSPVFGEVPCPATASQCPNLANIASTRSLSKTTGCCFDACGANCRFNTTTALAQCTCSPAVAYTAVDGICAPVCHGAAFTVSGGSVSCDCSSYSSLILNRPSAYMTSTCLVVTCENGGTRIGPSGPCTCLSPYSGPTCSINVCEERGTLNETRRACDCARPFRQSPDGKLCEANTCGSGGNIAAIVNSQTGLTSYECICPSNLLYSGDRKSCVPVNCVSAPTSDCAVCKHGVGFVRNNAIVCDCSSVDFTGADCSIPICDHGVPDTRLGRCNCTGLYTGPRCSVHPCQHGGSPSRIHPNKCNCTSAYNGTLCQFLKPVPPAPLAPSSTGHALSHPNLTVHEAPGSFPVSSSSSSSSSSGGGSSTASAIGGQTDTSSSGASVVTVAISSSPDSVGAIVGGTIGGVAGLLLIVAWIAWRWDLLCWSKTAGYAPVKTTTASASGGTAFV